METLYVPNFRVLNTIIMLFRFLMAGIGVGIGAFMTLVYTPSVTTTTAGDIGMNIMVAIVLEACRFREVRDQRYMRL